MFINFCNKRFLLFLLLFGIIAFFNSCITFQNPYNSVAPGVWRGTLKIADKATIENQKGEPLPELMDITFEEVTEGELPFNFEVIYTNDTSFYIELINGEERIKCEHITIGRDRATAKDTIVIDFPVFDTYLKAVFEEKVMEGEWVVNYKENYSIPFIARQGKDHRFTELKKDPIIDVSGRWEATFGIDGEAPYPAVGEFKQKCNELRGTFMTETGDYRFLEGTVQENKLYLSCFDGAHAFMFEGKILPDSSIIGSFRSGSHYKTLWKATRNENARLANPDSLTNLTGQQFEFSFPNAEGEMVSLDDPAYSGKAKLIMLLGTWCPNCSDASKFVVDYLENNPSDELAVIGLAFERYSDKEKALDRLKTYRTQMNIPYEVLLAGSYNKKEALKSLPMLNEIISYPTMIFLDKNNQVKRIHTGFSGPATSQFEPFKTDFTAFMARLLAG